MKRTVDNGVKKNLKPCAYKLSESERMTACLLHNEPTSCASPARLSAWEARSRSESESE